jgi:lipoprotein-anchoring transpeptidase ErfK/SrfK
MENNNIIEGESLPDDKKQTGEPELNDNFIDGQSDNSSLNRVHEKGEIFKALRGVIITVIYFFAGIALILFLLYIIPALQEMYFGQETHITNNPELKKSSDYKKQISLISKDIQRLSRKYNAYTSGQSYIVINTTDNRFYLYRNKKLIREGFCSSGSYTLLQTQGDKKWIFKTPKGKYWIRGKTTNPVWKRPDWSFVEEGLPIPPKDDYSRYEYGVLGDYALAIGDGYLIHGTIYKRFLGMPVTHGCVRLNDDDLKVIFNTLSVGSKVYIF